jgi:hypothetical protein
VAVCALTSDLRIKNRFTSLVKFMWPHFDIESPVLCSPTLRRRKDIKLKLSVFRLERRGSLGNRSAGMGLIYILFL